uniref:Repulsive guidance molecule BMP co-receptor b n=1 Tax=Hucho hucho TaxID=62062 RepID=A0A4W5M411_9TELE
VSANHALLKSNWVIAKMDSVITIIFKPFEECTDQRVYQAVTDDLPAAFVDGTVRALWISERSPGHHVELHAGYIGVTVIVRQLGRYLTLAVRIPEEMAHAYDASQDLQLCLNGCPTSERIDRGGHLPLAPQRFSVEGARARCREQLELQDIYFHSCVFDLLTTGDANFTAAAFSALKDMESLHPHRERWRIFPQSSADTSQPITWLPLLTLFALRSALV